MKFVLLFLIIIEWIKVNFFLFIKATQELQIKGNTLMVFNFIYLYQQYDQQTWKDSSRGYANCNCSTIFWTYYISSETLKFQRKTSIVEHAKSACSHHEDVWKSATFIKKLQKEKVLEYLNCKTKQCVARGKPCNMAVIKIKRITRLVLYPQEGTLIITVRWNM